MKKDICLYVKLIINNIKIIKKKSEKVMYVAHWSKCMLLPSNVATYNKIQVMYYY